MGEPFEIILDTVRSKAFWQFVHSPEIPMLRIALRVRLRFASLRMTWKRRASAVHPYNITFAEQTFHDAEGIISCTKCISRCDEGATFHDGFAVITG